MIPFFTQKARWSVFEPKDTPPELGAYSRPMRLAMEKRGLTCPEVIRRFLHGGLGDLHSPFLLKGMEKAVDLFLETVGRKGKIRIFGDYDADGVTSAASLISFFKEYGAEADCFIPNRLEEGYGIAKEGADTAASDGISLAITVDCGISANERIRQLKESGIRTVILDHHTLPPELPDADAIVNPMNPECGYPCKHLSGVGLAFKFIQGVCERKGAPLPVKYLIPAAIGLIADLMPLKDEARIIVREGLRIMPSCRRDWPGVYELIKGQQDRITSRAISFSIAPLLNAAGRLGDCSTALNLLLAETPERAEKLARELRAINSERQRIEKKMREEIIFGLHDKIKGKRVLVESGHGLHAGVIGITSAKLAEEFGMPVFLIAVKDGIGRGSCRSSDGYNVHTMLYENSDILLTYGGHRQAGGFSIEEDKIPVLEERLRDRPPDQPLERLESDGFLTLGDVTEKAIGELEMLSPTGKENEPPVFMFRNLRVKSIERKNKNVLSAVFSDGRARREAVAFGAGHNAASFRPDSMTYSIAASLYLNDYNNEPSLRIESVIENDRNAEMALSGEAGLIKGSPGSPALIDASAVIDRIYYAAALSENGKTAVLARDQTKKAELEAAFSKRGARRTPEVLLAKEADRDDYPDDLVLTGPPFSESVYSSRLFRRCKRIHFLYGDEESEFEMRYLEESRPDAKKAARLAECIRLSVPAWQSLPKTAAACSGLTVDQTAYLLRIFEELGILSRDENGRARVSRTDISEEEITGSVRYGEYKRTEEGLRELQTLRGSDFAAFSERVLELIRKE